MKIQKYRIYQKMIKPLGYSEYPSIRLLKFKRSKWIRLKSKFRKKLSRLLRRIRKNRVLKSKKLYNLKKTRKKKPLRLHSTPTFKKFNSYEKIKKSYKMGLLQKNSFFQFFGSSLSLKYLKRLSLSKNNVFYEFLIRPYFKLDILLWKLKFFYSIKQAQQHIKNKNVSVNGFIISTPNFFLSRGDIITLAPTNVKIFQKPGINNSFTLSFCDVDFYSYKIILLKGVSELNHRDFSLIFERFTILRNFIYYLRKK